ncbi:MAG TPA: CoA transferase [Dehalococcoidia bacterium]|nr:CoA transferase [Dehalococcoidia bacterium]
MTAVLEGIKVLDVSQVAAVPMGARHLGDYGADVIHVEHATRGDSWRVLQAGHGGGAGVPSEINYNWEAFNRNKRSLALDLSHESGREILYKLVENADVFLTNLRLPEKEKHKISYEALKLVNPKIIYGSLTGHGTKGFNRETPAYDTTVYWGRSGVSSTLTNPGLSGPALRPAFGDVVAGMSLAFGVMMALYHRDKTGLGQEINISLLLTGIYQLTFDVSAALATGQDIVQYRLNPPEVLDPDLMKRRDGLIAQVQESMAQLGDLYRENAPNPLANLFYTKDGKRIIFNALQPDRFWAEYCRVIERPDLVEDPRFSTTEARAENNTELYHILRDAFLTKTLEEWTPDFVNLPFAPMQDTVDVANDPQAIANDMFIPVEHPTYGPIRVIASPLDLSETPATYRLPAPEFSQHTEEILLEIGYSWEDIAGFKEKGTIA